MKFIRKALAINADAHFGREKYQLWLVQWLQSRKKAEPVDEDDRVSRMLSGNPQGFALFLATQASLNEKQRRDAVRGVLGMMWFADHDNPLLLEALGDLLYFGPQETNAAQLAALSYLHAARKTVDDAEKKRLTLLSESAVRMTHGFDDSGVSKLLDLGLAKGREYMESVRKDELAWIEAGEDAGALFQKKYLAR